MKKILVWLLGMALLLTGIVGITGCRFTQNGGGTTASYVLDSEKFNPTVVYGESVNLSGLNIVKTVGEEVTVIPVTESMITIPTDTSKVGVSEIKISYESHDFSVPVSVKYKIILKADGEVFDTLYVMTKAELADISAPEKEGYLFNGWNPEIPDTLAGNLTLEATYTEAVPALTEVGATYGDKLGDITLPSNAAGKWVFDTPESTVGNAGKRDAAVSFVLNATGEVLKTDKVKINVAKRDVKFTDVKTEFVYNGKKQIPTYVADADVDIIFYEQSGANYTDAGTYEYYFEVDDANYKGVLEGNYTITKVNVTVKINSYSVFSNEQLPKVAYEVSGFGN